MKMMNRLELRHIVCPIDFSGQFRSVVIALGVSSSNGAGAPDSWNE